VEQPPVVIPDMTDPNTALGDLLIRAPGVLRELTGELIRRGDVCMKADPTSQETACFLLALRGASLLWGMAELLQPATFDTYDVAARAFLEARDLLMTFRFDDDGIRKQVAQWFNGGNDDSWKPRHKHAEQFMRRIGGGATEFSKRWSAFSVLSHPTVHSAKHSAAIVVRWFNGKQGDLVDATTLKVGDCLVSISTLVVAATLDRPGWVPLGCDLARLPQVDPFRAEVARVTAPMMGSTNKISLPPESYRS
jgi:hypothetical protein